MVREDDCRRRMSTAYLDRWQDRLDLMRNQQRRTRSIYEGLYAGNESKAGAAHGVPPASGDRSEATAHEHGWESASTEIRRRRLAVLIRIESLTDFSDAVRREWRFRFDSIDPWRLMADEALDRFAASVTACTSELQDISGQLAARVDHIETHCATLGHSGMLFDAGLDAIALRIRTLSFLDGATRQRWADELGRIDTARSNPLIGFLHRPSQADYARPANAARRVLAEIDSAARCSALFAALALLRSACNRYRDSLSGCGQSSASCADANTNLVADAHAPVPCGMPFLEQFQRPREIRAPGKVTG